MTAKKIVKYLCTHLTIEQIVRFTARRTADAVYYSIPLFTDPKVALGLTAAVQISQVASKRFRRTNFDPVIIFEDSIDAVLEAY